MPPLLIGIALVDETPLKVFLLELSPIKVLIRKIYSKVDSESCRTYFILLIVVCVNE